jgi:hypothetical protein
MSAVEKFSVSLPADLAQFARERAEEKGLSLSAYLASCIEPERRQRALREFLEEIGESADSTSPERYAVELELAEIEAEDARTRVERLRQALRASTEAAE